MSNQPVNIEQTTPSDQNSDNLRLQVIGFLRQAAADQKKLAQREGQETSVHNTEAARLSLIAAGIGLHEAEAENAAVEYFQGLKHQVQVDFDQVQKELTDGTVFEDDDLFNKTSEVEIRSLSELERLKDQTTNLDDITNLRKTIGDAQKTRESTQRFQRIVKLGQLQQRLELYQNITGALT